MLIGTITQVRKPRKPYKAGYYSPAIPSTVPATAITLNAQPITLNGQYLTKAT